MDKYDIIMNAEQQFAREVTLGVIVTRPLTAWHTIIPGFFIIDYLRRGSAIRQYTEHFMFPRKLALDVAVSEIRGENKEALRPDLEPKIETWLESLKLYSPDLVKAHMVLVEILANGLGLSSCQRIVERRHKGKLSFVSRPGEGTTFSFTMPIASN